MKNLLIIAVIFNFAFAKAQTSLPEITLKNLDGKEVSLTSISENKTVVVSLWALGVYLVLEN
ncbi:hypothetical protein JCM19298_2362 [Nonlabens ulvanivorans]|nr:peroxiredoxin family protein [Nonlabens ulvanivorans]GAK91874.1 hypothetical protein JCM19298_2362 [Nonlabens ulvanivorans]